MELWRGRKSSPRTSNLKCDSRSDVPLASLQQATRDSLRLEAGLCLYGNDLDDTTSPSEGSLLWVIAKRRRTEAGGFVGSDRILAELPPKQGGTKKVSRKRAGFIVNKGAPARSGAKVFDMDGAEVGVVTSGGMSPCLKKGIGMVYVKTGLQKEATAVPRFAPGSEWQESTPTLRALHVAGGGWTACIIPAAWGRVSTPCCTKARRSAESASIVNRLN